MAVLGLSCTIGIRAAKQAAVDHRVEVYLSDADGSEELFGPVKPLVSGIFEEIGIGLDWRHGELPGERRGQSLIFGVHTHRHAPKTASPDALACARIIGLCGRDIEIYRDRVELLPDTQQRNGYDLVGFVLAHELAHLMIGTNEHSPSGIMKARWSSADMREMRLRGLYFSSMDIARIRLGLAVQLAAQRIEELMLLPAGIEER